MTGFSSQLLLLLTCFTFMVCKPARAQYQGYIYAEVVLKNKQTYTGPIKWSGGQRLWSDVLSVTKSTNKNIFKYLDESQIKRLPDEEGGKEVDWKFMSLFEDKFPQRKNEILCRFGDIDFIHDQDQPDAGKYTDYMRFTKPFPMAPVTVISAKEAFDDVLKNAGATLPQRDPVDARVVEQVRTGKITYPENVKLPATQFEHRRLPIDSYKMGIITDVSQVGGYPEYKGTAYKDTDSDGLPDTWEKQHADNQPVVLP